MEEINKFLAEAMGECWHNWKLVEDTPPFRVYQCWECDVEQMNPKDNNDFSTWEGFGKLWEWSVKQEWWLDFIKQSTYLDNSPEEIEADIFHLKLGIIDFIVPTKFAKAVFIYLQNKV